MLNILLDKPRGRGDSLLGESSLGVRERLTYLGPVGERLAERI